jgi:uncharacterized protein (DUF1684 family)
MRRTALAVPGLLAAAVSVSLLAQGDASRLAAVTAAQQTVAREFANALLSPFTSVASRYLTAGDAARLVVDGNAVAFAEPSAPGGAVDLTFDGRDIWVSPIAGGPAADLVKKRGEEGVQTAGATPLRTRTRARDEVLVRIGRYYLETGARPGTGRAIVYDPEAPLRKAYTGLHWFPASAAFQVRASYAPLERPDPIVVATSRGLEKDYFRTGVFSFELQGRSLRLVALANSASPKPGDELFVPFRDATTGHESYGVGRYLNVLFQGAGADYLLDFNLATSPYCAYSPHYNCVIPPKENTLAVAIRAGEMIYAPHDEPGAAAPQRMEPGLAGWEFVTDPPVPLAQVCVPGPGGVYRVAGSPVGYVATNAIHRDYRVHAEWRWTGEPGNSGLLVHISSGPKDRQWPVCLQVQWKDTAVGDVLPMAGATFREPLSTPPGAKTPQLTRSGQDSERPPGEWNTCDVVCRGDTIEVIVNGVVQNRVTGVSTAEGRVGFQLEGTPFELRNVSITPLR